MKSLSRSSIANHDQKHRPSEWLAVEAAELLEVERSTEAPLMVVQGRKVNILLHPVQNVTDDAPAWRMISQRLPLNPVVSHLLCELPGLFELQPIIYIPEKLG